MTGNFPPQTGIETAGKCLYSPEIRCFVATVPTANHAASRGAPPGYEAIRPGRGDRLQTQHALFYSSKKLLANLCPVQ
jgi:hypothetical protein